MRTYGGLFFFFFSLRDRSKEYTSHVEPKTGTIRERTNSQLHNVRSALVVRATVVNETAEAKGESSDRDRKRWTGRVPLEETVCQVGRLLCLQQGWVFGPHKGRKEETLKEKGSLDRLERTSIGTVEQEEIRTYMTNKNG